MLFQNVCGEKRFVKNVYERFGRKIVKVAIMTLQSANANELVTEEASAYLGGH